MKNQVLEQMCFFIFMNDNDLNMFKQALMHLLLKDLSEHSRIIYIEDWMVKNRITVNG